MGVERAVTAPNPEFPVVCIAANGFVCSVSDGQSLGSCTPTALRSGYYDRLEVIDTAGQVFSVLGAREVPRPDEKLVTHLWRRLQGAHIRVDLELEAREQLPLSGVQDRVCEAMAKLPAQWEAVEDLSVAQKRVRRARSIREVIDMFAEE